jgi:hypothetical protein
VKKGRKPHKGSPFEKFTTVLLVTQKEPAWRALSSAAQALYPWLKLEWGGPQFNNNGSIRLSVRQAAASMGVTHVTAARAFHDLQRKGFIVMTSPASLGLDGEAKGATYELTELKMPGAEQDGRKLYRQWRPDQEFPVHVTAANNPAGNNGRKTKPHHRNYDSSVIESMTKTRRAS